MTIRNNSKYIYTLNQIIKAYEGKTYKRESTIRLHYRRIYERERNKLRNYERYTGAKKQSVSRFVKSRARWANTLRAKGLKYKPRETTKYIETFSGTRDKNINEYEASINTQQYINNQFGDLIGRDKYAQAIQERYADNPSKQLQALSDYATERQRRYSDIKKDATGRETIDKEGGIYSKEVSEEAYERIINTYDD